MKLVCPKCKLELGSVNDGLSCRSCSSTYGRKHGIVSFIEDVYSYGNIPMARWEEIFLAIEGKTNVEIQDYLLSQKFKGRWAYIQSFRHNKADGFSFLPVSAQDVILDIGCGPGSLTIPLSRVCREVYALDPTLPRLRFLEARRKNDGINNVTPIHASALNMPFSGPSFDYVLMNGVFEYVGEWGSDGNPEELQKTVLEEIYGLLKKGGRLFIAIENRYGYDFFYRERDHSKLYLTSLMPRFLASFFTLLFKRKTYRTYTYSYHRYNRLLKDAGFQQTEFYYVWPDYRNPKYIFSERDKNIFKYYLENFIKHQSGRLEYLFYRWAAGKGMEKHFVPHFIIMAHK
jgi:SAM-dependent methyltransferase